MNSQTNIQVAAPQNNDGSGIPDYLRPREAAQYVGHSASTLAKLRMRHMRKNGPTFIKRGGVILYRRDDLDEWLNNHRM